MFVPWTPDAFFFFWTCSSILLFLSFRTTAVNPGCECVRYTSTWGKEWGTFSSPDYPANYPRPIRCLLYSFSAPPGFIVHIQLDTLRLPPQTNNKNNVNNGCVDYLKLFMHVDDVRGGGQGGGQMGSFGVNENTPWTQLLCGGGADLSFHSSSRHLIIQFHSAPSALQPPTSQTHNTFIGRYRFLNSSQFVSTGRLMTGTKCDYQFVGSDDLTKEGRFFSPHYPSTYPYNVRCAYHFYASLHKRVRVVFETVALQPGEYSCLNKTDVIRVIDGSNTKAPVISLICNTVKDYEILSSGPHLQVEFLANSEHPGSGFRAVYQYVQVQLDSSMDNTRFTHSQDLLNGHDGLPQASTLVPACNQIITSDAGINGSFSSPNYPHYYSPKTACRYVFIGHGKERVEITFTDFSLFHPHEQPDSPHGSPEHHYLNPNRINDKTQTVHQRKCVGADVLSVWLYSDGQLEKMVDLCGHKLPAPIMSNGHRLTLEFNGASSASFARGFYANYAFVQDFGIKSGRQLRDYPCGFVYNSSVELSGLFTSPNYPGIYPRDTECHYFFYGAEEEQVVLTFNHFHLHGSPPCLEWTKSDYVEFSNYMPVDLEYGRKCGEELDPFRVISLSSFFRVTFRSNEEFDGGGFSASFQFTTQINQIIAVNDVRIETGHSSSNTNSEADSDGSGGTQLPAASSSKYSSHTSDWWLSWLQIVAFLLQRLLT